MKRRDHALVVLGCAIGPRFGSSADAAVGQGAAGRRVAAAAKAWRASSEPAASLEGERGAPGVLLGVPSVVIVSGGRVWNGRMEADAMASALLDLGVPESRLVRERLSFSTRENASFVAAQCARRGIDAVALVTCVWHLPRAAKCFEVEGLEVVARISAGEGDAGWAKRAWLRGKERALAALVAR